MKPALGMYAAIGLAVLAKGPIGVMLPVSVITFYAVLFNGHATAQHASDSTSRWQSMWLTTCALLAPQRLWRIAGGLRAVLGAATVAAVALPWYVAVTYATEGEWLTGFLGTHNVHRFLHPMEGHSGPIFYYVIAILAGFFPGSCFLPVAIVSAMRDKRKRAPLAHSQAFLLCWVGCYLVFFSLAATKLPNYIVPCYPALALLTGYWLVSALRTSSPPRFWLRMGMGSLALVGLALAIGLGTASVMFMDGNLTVAIAGLIPLVGGVVSLVYLNKENHQRALLCFAATSVLFTVVATGIAAPRISPYQTSPRIAHHLSEIESASVAADVQFATFRYTKPNIVFYLGRAVPGLVSEDEAVKLLSDNTNSFLVLPETEYDKLRSRLPAEVAVIHNEPKFFKPSQRIVVVGRQAQLTQRWAGNTTITK